MSITCNYFEVFENSVYTFYFKWYNQRQNVPNVYVLTKLKGTELGIS